MRSRRASVPAGAATTSMILSAAVRRRVGGAARAARARRRRPWSSSPRSPLEKADAGADRLHVRHLRPPAHRRVHVFDGRGHARRNWPALTAKGLTHDQIIEYFVKKYGSQEVLASPIDEGFNRLAWLLPYGVGLVGVVASSAWRCDGRDGGADSRRRGAPAARDAALESRLDDELRDLD